MSCHCNCSHPRTYGGLGCGTACLTFPILPDNPFIPLPECPDAPCCDGCTGCCQQRCCATGPTGPMGPQGATGPRGATGATGPAGTAITTFANYYQTGTLGNTSYDRALQLASGDSMGDIETDGRNVTLCHAGAYHIIYSINVPDSFALSTDFYLEANGEKLPGTVIHLENNGLHGSIHLTGHYTFTTDENTTLRLLADHQFSIHGASDDDVLAAMTIMRIH